MADRRKVRGRTLPDLREARPLPLVPPARRGRNPSRQRQEDERPIWLLTACAVTGFLLLAGCNAIGWPKLPPVAAASASAWMKPGLDAASVESAFADCREVANTATETDFNIDQDISASRGSDLQHSAFAGAPLRDAQQNDRDRAQTILSSCMEGKGFTPAR